MSNLDSAKSGTVMAVDPVCGMKVDPATAKFSQEHGGQTYFFCCGGCREKFRADPARYLSRDATKPGAPFAFCSTPPASKKMPWLACCARPDSICRKSWLSPDGCRLVKSTLEN